MRPQCIGLHGMVQCAIRPTGAAALRVLTDCGRSMRCGLGLSGSRIGGAMRLHRGCAMQIPASQRRAQIGRIGNNPPKNRTTGRGVRRTGCAGHSVRLHGLFLNPFCHLIARSCTPYCPCRRPLVPPPRCLRSKPRACGCARACSRISTPAWRWIATRRSRGISPARGMTRTNIAGSSRTGSRVTIRPVSATGRSSRRPHPMHSSAGCC